jgi:hypothetical protein
MAKHSPGFSVVEVIVVLVIIAAAGFGGWYVWSKHHKDDSNKSNTSTQGNNENQNQTTADPSEGGKYLVIKEWGVRFKLPEDLKGQVTYGIRTSTDGAQVAVFEVASIAALPGSSCKLTDISSNGWSGKTGGIGSEIHRTTAKIGSDQEALFAFSNMHINNYWYSGLYGKGADACVNDESKQQLAGDTGRNLTFSLSSLEQVQD